MRTHFIIEYLKGNYKCDSMMSMHRLTGLSSHGSYSPRIKIIAESNFVNPRFVAVVFPTRITLFFNPFKPEFTIVIFIHYKPRIAVAILDL